MLLLGDLDGRRRRDARPAGVSTRSCSGWSEPFTLAGAEFHVEASIGIAIYPDDADGAEALLQHADSRCTRPRAAAARRRASTRRRHAGPARAALAAARLRRALARGEFALHYQPIVRIGQRAAALDRGAAALATTPSAGSCTRDVHPGGRGDRA